MSWPQVLAVIPARYHSTRFPGKPLARIAGRPMIEWVYQMAHRAIKNVVVATDDNRIKDAVQGFGGKVLMTPQACKSGTDRMFYVSKKRKAHYYVNVQGDEPVMEPETIRRAVQLSTRKKEIATAATLLKKKDIKNPNAVKVIIGKQGRAIHFARQGFRWKSSTPRRATRVLKHTGLYVFPKDKLKKFVSYPQPKIEKDERLEQLRALYYGLPIYVSTSKHDSIGVDHPSDVKKVEKILKEK